MDLYNKSKTVSPYRIDPFDADIVGLVYRDELIRPIAKKLPSVWLNDGVHDSAEWEKLRRKFDCEAAEFFRDISSTREKKLAMLVTLFGLEQTDSEKWKRLALLLAIKHVPGFCVLDSSLTKPVKWTVSNLYHLLFAVQSKRARTGKSASHAIETYVREAAKQNQIDSIFSPKGGDEPSIKKRCQLLANKLSIAKNDRRVARLAKSMKARTEALFAASKNKKEGKLIVSYVEQMLSVRDTRQQWHGYNTGRERTRTASTKPAAGKK